MKGKKKPALHLRVKFKRVKCVRAKFKMSDRTWDKLVEAGRELVVKDEEALVQYSLRKILDLAVEDHEFRMKALKKGKKKHE